MASHSPSEKSGLEVEVKLRPAGLEEALAAIRGAGFAVSKPRSFERNVLYDTEGSRLRGEGVLLRVREFRGETVLTFKGKSIPGKHKQREEWETTATNGEALAKILTKLGFQPTFRYEKYRTVFRRGDEAGEITLDETPIGVFLELEGRPEWIDRVAGELDYSQADYITASYATLWLEHCARAGLEAGDFVF